ncbi:DUF6328 family protein [Glutamicibacter creatinolyticus]|uniref:DUF6328 family protein n=1 Tax=Glutamicibacter creatinolyticus TaxID=162496 RepID=UPI0037C110F5
MGKRRSMPDGSPEAPHRQWNELLQEMRVMQTGIQILAAFLVVLPFQSRFEIVEPREQVIYAVLLLVSVLLILLMIFPVAVHRYLFGQRVKATTVHLGHIVVKVVGIGVGLLICGCVWFVVQVLFGWQIGSLVGGSLMLVTIFLLVILPRLVTPLDTLPQQDR